MQGSGMGFRDGQAGEDEPDGDSDAGTGAAAIGLSDRESDAEKPGHIPHPDSWDQRGRGPGIDMGRCFLHLEANPRADGEGVCAGNEEEVPGRPHQRTAAHLHDEIGFPADRVRGQREAQAGIAEHAEDQLPECAQRGWPAGDDPFRPSANLCRPMPGGRDEL